MYNLGFPPLLSSRVFEPPRQQRSFPSPSSGWPGSREVQRARSTRDTDARSWAWQVLAVHGSSRVRARMTKWRALARREHQLRRPQRPAHLLLFAMDSSTCTERPRESGRVCGRSSSRLADLELEKEAEEASSRSTRQSSSGNALDCTSDVSSFDLAGAGGRNPARSRDSV